MPAEDERQRVRENRDRPAGGDDDPVEAGLQLPAGIRGDELQHACSRKGARGVADRVERDVVGSAPEADEPAHGDKEQEPAGAVVGPAGPRDQAGNRERPPEQEIERDRGVAARVRARQLEDECERAEARRGCSPGGETETVGCQARSADSAAPDSSAFGMKPRAPERSTRGPKSEPSRLETSTTAGPPSSVRRRATSNPSMSGS